MKRVKITDKYIAFIDTNLNNEQVQVQMPYDEFVNLCKPNQQLMSIFERMKSGLRKEKHFQF